MVVYVGGSIKLVKSFLVLWYNWYYWSGRAPSGSLALQECRPPALTSVGRTADFMPAPAIQVLLGSVIRQSRKVNVLIQWLGCFNDKNAKLSELGDGLKLLKLLPSIKPECAAEDVTPVEAFVPIEQTVIGLHGYLPPGFLSSASKSDCRDGILALAAALALSSVVLHATWCGATEDMRPLLALEEASKSFIKDVVQTASAWDSVLRNLRSYLRAKTAETRPSAAISPPSCPAYSASFTFSPTSADSPSKPSPLKTPERHPLKLWEIQLLREQIRDEEQTSANLQAEVSRLKKALRGRDKEINRQRERLATLEAGFSKGASCLKRLRDRIQLLKTQNGLLEQQLLSMQRVQANYDDLIRQNAQLQEEKQQLAKLAAELQSLEEGLATTLSHGVSTPRQPTEHRSSSCFQELHLVELEEDSARLRSELEEKMGQSSALRATIVQLEEARARLEAEGSQLTQYSAQQNLSITELQIELLGYKTLAAQLEPGLTVRKDHLDNVNDQAEVIGCSSSAAGDVVELLESNVDLDVAFRSSETAQATQGHSSCQTAAENRSHLGASPEQCCSVVCTEDEEDLVSVITDVAEGFESFLSDILAEGVDLQQTELGEGSSSLTLSKQPSCVEGEKGAPSPLPLEMQDKLMSPKVSTEHTQALVRDLEVLCLELHAALTDEEPRLAAVGDENAALVKIKEEVQRANVLMRSQLECTRFF
ncbi:uncharacterized protein LOC144156312 [Haemaphysalis longicornis]